ncbi:MAG: hypothetical protein KDE45_01790, partial [Caldilineaceae bacterium]|nr:hypothetical protein [Caldilineaceae bacterium]
RAAYGDLIPKGRFPLLALFVTLDPRSVDVNVHPTKSEVRFRDSQQLYRLVLSTLRTKFLTMDIAAGHRLVTGGTTSESSPQPADPAEQQRAQQELANWARRQLAGWKPNADLSDLEARVESPDSAATDATGRNDSQRSNSIGVWPAASESPDVRGNGNSEIPAGNDSTPPTSPQGNSGAVIQHVSTSNADARPASADAEVRAMQVHDCYLVIETSNGLTVIDQHALHERIMYEHLRNRVLAGGVEVQRLLMPITVELSPREAALLIDQQELLQELGLLVESFGGSTVAVTGYPVLTRKADPVELVKAVVEQLEQTDGKVSRRDLLDSLLHMMACKAAIKAGQRLSPDEIEALLSQRHLVDDAHHCPHGRPTALTLSRQELDRQFGRLG